MTKEKSPQKFMSKSDIFNIDDLKYDVVNVEAWGGKAVRVRTLTAKEKDAFEQHMLDHTETIKDEEGKVVDSKSDISGARVRLMILCVVDEQGVRLFRDTDQEKLERKAGTAVNEIWEVASILNGIGEKAKENTAKN